MASWFVVDPVPFEGMMFHRHTTARAIDRILLAATFAFLGIGRGLPAAAADDSLILWYRQPASKWVEALPLGSGRLGAMVFGGVLEDRLQLNEDTLWAGGPYEPANPAAPAALPEVRRLVFAGEFREAHKLIDKSMMAVPLREMPYQLVGDLRLTFEHGEASSRKATATAEDEATTHDAAETEEAEQASDYRRQLDLDAATATVEYSLGGVRYRREYFVSPVDQALVVRLSADRPGSVSLAATFDSPMPEAAVRADGERTLVLSGRNGSYQGIEGKLKFESRLQVRAEGGRVEAAGDALRVVGADSATLLVVAATSYVNSRDVSGDPEAANRRTLAAATDKSWESLHAAHVAEHRRLFRRVTLDLGTTPAAQRPTDVRIQTAMESDDPALASLYFQFARYLLICCSRPGTQPANLQGLWNDSLQPPWESKYTININTEMNYWPAESTNLAECVEPLVRMTQELSETARRTARVHYGMNGWVAHHNTDLWRASGPVDASFYGMWPTGGAWLCKHLWDRYDYGRDAKYLAEVYPTLKGACEFFLDYLVPHPEKQWLVTVPSISPEHAHHEDVGVCAGPAMDMQILRDLFANTAAAAKLLGVDAPLREQVLATRAKLAPDQIGAAGQLQEWVDDWDMQAPDRNHRHVSHLYGLFPSDQIDVRATPELAAAARRSLEIRGDNATGWGIGWRINLWAALGEGDHAHQVLRSLLCSRRTYPNMFDAHPPFQIDGNFGGASGIAEMLLQCRQGEIRLLPALPEAWAKGSVTGLRARGNLEVDLAWEQRRLAHATVRGAAGSRFVLRYGEQRVEQSLKASGWARFDGQLAEGD